MEAHAHAVAAAGGDVLNVGFGLGLVDEVYPLHHPMLLAVWNIPQWASSISRLSHSLVASAPGAAQRAPVGSAARASYCCARREVQESPNMYHLPEEQEPVVVPSPLRCNDVRMWTLATMLACAPQAARGALFRFTHVTDVIAHSHGAFLLTWMLTCARRPPARHYAMHASDRCDRTLTRRVDVDAATDADLDADMDADMGAQAIQRRSPRSHTIVEAHPDVHARMLQLGWDQRPGVRILFGRWQDVLPSLGAQFDGIFFDTFSEFYGDMQYAPCLLAWQPRGCVDPVVLLTRVAVPSTIKMHRGFRNAVRETRGECAGM